MCTVKTNVNLSIAGYTGMGYGTLFSLLKNCGNNIFSKKGGLRGWYHEKFQIKIVTYDMKSLIFRY